MYRKLELCLNTDTSGYNSVDNSIEEGDDKIDDSYKKDKLAPLIGQWDKEKEKEQEHEREHVIPDYDERISENLTRRIVRN